MFLEQPRVTIATLFGLWLLVLIYANNEFINVLESNSCKSFICSPTPMYLTGILNWSLIPITTHPLAVTSNLVSANEETSVAAVNCLACSNAF